MREVRKPKPVFEQKEMFGDHETYVVVAHNYYMEGNESIWTSSQIMWRQEKDVAVSSS